MSNIPILFEDAEALVIDKPARLPIDRPRRGGPALVDVYEDLKFGFMRPPAPAHRLDTDTSGCLLLARNPKALKRYCAAFEARTVIKIYHGILDGVPEESEGRIDLSLTKISSAEQGWRMIPAKKGKVSVTLWRVIDIRDGRALVEFRPETGRTHQIRVHAASGLGIPLMHDPVYGTGRRSDHTTRTLLHASVLKVPREKKEAIIAYAPLPIEFTLLGFEQPDLGQPPAPEEIAPEDIAPEEVVSEQNTPIEAAPESVVAEDAPVEAPPSDTPPSKPSSTVDGGDG